MSRETRRLIQNGLLQGKSIPEMVRGIVPPKLSIEPALYRQARSNSFSIIRTTVNAVQNHAAVESYRAAGNDISDSFRLSAVRDARTTAICRALDGLVQRNDNPGEAAALPHRLQDDVHPDSQRPVPRALGADAAAHLRFVQRLVEGAGAVASGHDLGSSSS
jgi:hypothetical protein